MKQTLKYIYERLFENLKYAETKHSITMTIASAIIAFSSTFFSQDRLINILTSTTIMLSLLSIIYSFIALLSRKIEPKNEGRISKHNNLMYYKTIKDFTTKEYVKALQKKYEFPSDYKTDEMDMDLARQVITTAKLVNLKFNYFNFSLIYLFVSLICGIVVVCVKGNII